jgi:hypothetical protein
LGWTGAVKTNQEIFIRIGAGFSSFLHRCGKTRTV